MSRAAPFVLAVVVSACGAGRPPAPDTPLPPEPRANAFIRKVDDIAIERGERGGLEARMLIGPGSLPSERAAVAWFRIAEDSVFGSAHPCFELHGIVLSGTGDMLDPRGVVHLVPGDATYVPARYPFAIVAVGGPLEILQVFTADEGLENCEMQVRAAEEPIPPEDREGLFATQHVVRTADSPWIPIAAGKGRVQLLVDDETTGARLAYLGHLVAEPGLAIPAHVHETSDEILLVRSGRGVMTIDGDDMTVQAGMIIRIPANTEHAFVAEGDVPVEAVQIYAGPGPEQRFRAARDAAGL
jgi:mannose-6-phosphate isomerase-like protein (cupin superfamily)